MEFVGEPWSIQCCAQNVEVYGRCANIKRVIATYGHVLRRDDDSVLRVALDLEVSGKRKRG